MARPKYQLFPPLTPEEYDALKADIATRGVQVPVDVDEHGEILDGHHRDQVCEELGIKNYPKRILSGLTEEQKRHHVLAVNLNRRHLSTKQKRELVAQELRRSPKTSNNWLAKLTGVTDKTVAAIRRELVSRSEIPNVSRFQGEDGKEYRVRSITVQNSREAERARRALAALGDDAPVKALNLLRAEELARRKRIKTNGEVEQKPISVKGIELHNCDFRDLDLKTKSVRLVLADPPYTKEWLPLWEDLGEFAARVLAPGGLLVAYTGVVYLPQVMSALSKHLRYIWTCSYTWIHPGNQRKERQVYKLHQIAQGWKPILIFANGKYKPEGRLKDVLFSEGPAKDHHAWEQQLDAPNYFIKALTKPGQLVCDPCGGSFGTAISAYRLGRKFIGCDIEPTCVSIGHERLKRILDSKVQLRATR